MCRDPYQRYKNDGTTNDGVPRWSLADNQPHPNWSQNDLAQQLQACAGRGNVTSRSIEDRETYT